VTEQIKLPPRRRTLLRWLTEQARGVEQRRERSPTLDAALETIERDSDIGGAMLAGALAYRLFLFALPLAFFLISVAGLLAEVFDFDPKAIPDSVGFAGVIAKQVAGASNSSTNWWVALTAVVALAYAARLLFRAVSIVHALAWERSAAAVKVSANSLGVFAAAGLAQILLGFCVGAVAHRSLAAGIVAVLVYALALAALWLLVSLQVPHGDARRRELLPGSILYAVGITGVGFFNVLILGALIASKSSAYGALGMAATLLLGLFFVGRFIVGAAVVNATLHDRRRRAGVGHG
jgi:uncharacterized BrkB/YihY/UPF0761 family membrane protein